MLATTVIKRDGRSVQFDRSRIFRAISKAYQEVYGDTNIEFLSHITDRVEQVMTQQERVSVEDIQDQVEKALAALDFAVARRYILYREERARARAQTTKYTALPTRVYAAVVDAVRAYGATPLDHINALRIVEEATPLLLDTASADDIDTVLVMVGRSLIERAPEYSEFTARVLLRKLYREVMGFDRLIDATEDDHRHALFVTLEYGIEHERFDPHLYDEFDVRALSEAIVPSRDFNFKYLGLQTLYDRYFVHVGGQRIETPQTFWMRVAMGLALAEPTDKTGWAIKFYDALSTFRLCSSTPTLFNAGTLHPQLSSCFKVDAEVTTPLGSTPIGELRVGDLVLAANGRFERVTAVAHKPNTKRIRDLGLVGMFGGHTSLSPTEDHLIDSIIHTHGGIEAGWHAAGLVNAGDYVAMNCPTETVPHTYHVIDHLDERPYEVIEGMVYKLCVDETRNRAGEISKQVKPVSNTVEASGAFGRWLGYYLAEGYVSSNRDLVRFTFNSGDTAAIDDAEDLSQRLFGCETGRRENSDGSTNVDIHSTIVGQFVAALVGSGFNTKRLPLELMRAPLDFTEQLLVGVLCGDGFFQNKGSVGVQLSNERLVRQLFQLGLKCGFLPTFSRPRMNPHGTEQPSMITFGSRDAERLLRQVSKFDGLLDYAPKCAESKRGALGSFRFRLNGKAYYRVKNASYSQFDGDVYDIEVENDHTFSVNGVNVHNCYLSTVEDDLASIFKLYADNAQLSKWAGGLGIDMTPIRSLGSHIKSVNGKSSGTIPFIKIMNDTVAGVSQAGKRRGSGAVYMEIWHADFEEFLDLRKNTGDERRRAHDLNTAAWIPDLFMERVEADGTWTLLSPSDAPDLHDRYGADFANAYTKYEGLVEAGVIQGKRVSAVNLWRQVLGSLFETGHPWITFKDPSNLRNTQQHAGIIHSSNLCTEILLNTSRDEVAVCNLLSINLASHIDTLMEWGIDEAKLAESVTLGVRMLDNVIDINFYPVPEARNSNLRHRPVGLGLMGFQDALWAQDISYADEHAVDFADASMEMIAYYAIQASALLAKERGRYASYEGSLWDQGYLPIDTVAFVENSRQRDTDVALRRRSKSWLLVRSLVAQFGMRNSNVMAIAPTATIANIQGVTQSIEPMFSNLYVKSNLSGDFTVVNEHLVNDLRNIGLWNDDMLELLKYYDGSIQAIPSIPDYLKAKYPNAFEIDAEWLIEAAARRQKWIDMGQSLNLYLAAPSGKRLHDLYFLAWERGLKTTYYLRTRGATTVEKSTVDINKFGVQPIWMQHKSASADVIINREPQLTVEYEDEFNCEQCQ